MKRRGQFYLIAALVIIAVITGLATIYNYAKVTEEDTTVYDLTSEIDYEASQVIDRGLFSNATANISFQLENLTDYYARTNTGSDFLIIFGNSSLLTILLYNSSSTGSIGVSLGNTNIAITQSTVEGKSSVTISLGSQRQITIILPPGVEYTFTLGEGQMFYLVLRKEEGGESYVSGSDKSTKSGEG